MEQIFNPNINIGAVRGWCLKYVDDAGNAPSRTASAQIAFNNERNAGRIRTSEIPNGVWVVGFLTFRTGQYQPYGHVFFIRRDGQSYQLRDSETNGGGRGIYRSINEMLAWFGAYSPIYTGWSTHCDGREYARDKGGSVETIKSMYWRLLGREADHGGINTYTKAANERGWEFVYNDLKNSPEGQKDWVWRNPDRVRALEKNIADRDKQIADLQKALANEKNKPPVEVIKEVEKIVEKEVIKEVPTGPVSEQEVVTNWLIKLWNGLFKK